MHFTHFSVKFVIIVVNIITKIVKVKNFNTEKLFWISQFL